MLRRVALIAVISCQAPSQSPPPIEVGRPPPMVVAQPRPRSIEEWDSWDTTPGSDAGAAEPVAPPPVRCPAGSIFRQGACVIQDVRCPPGTTKVGSRCNGEVVCPASSQWDGAACRPVPTPPGSSPAAAPLGSCTLQINSIPQTTVFVDGTFAGLTPRMAMVVPPGTHTVVFVHETLGKKVVTARCAAGERKGVYAKLVNADD